MAEELDPATTAPYRYSGPVQVELVWEPAWTTDRMSASAKDFMGW
jgi:metal-sulfur cluster biosynthetic enzyme